MAEEREITAPLESEELQEGWDAKAAARPRVAAVIRFGAKTDLGQVRENNEDKFDCLEPDDPVVLASKGRVYAVADGMGGHSAGQIASELGLKLFIRSYYSDPSSDAPGALLRAVRAANGCLQDVAKSIPGRGDMGTTLTAAVIRDDDLFVVQVGDSRLYCIRGGEIEQVTEDHSWVAEHVRRGTMTREEAEQSQFRNVITRSLGGAPEVEPDIFTRKVLPGDRYIICSDGLSGMVDDADLLREGSAHSPSVAAWNLVELANERGGKDNVTVVLLEVASVEPYPEPEPEGEVGVHEDRAMGRPEPVAAERLAGPAESRPDAAVEEAAAQKPGGGLVRRLFGRR